MELEEKVGKLIINFGSPQMKKWLYEWADQHKKLWEKDHAKGKETPEYLGSLNEYLEKRINLRYQVLNTKKGAQGEIK